MLHRQLRKHHTIPQPIRQLLYRGRLMRAREPEPAELRPPRLHVLLGVLLAEQALEVLDGTEVVRELVGRVLRVLGELELGVLLDGAFGGLERAGYQVEQGGFAGTVGAEDGDAGVHAMRGWLVGGFVMLVVRERGRTRYRRRAWSRGNPWVSQSTRMRLGRRQ